MSVCLSTLHVYTLEGTVLINLHVNLSECVSQQKLYSLGTRCPCTLKQSLLSKITYINTLSDLLSK